MDLVFGDWNQCEIFTWKSMEVVTQTGYSISSTFEDLWKGYMRQTHPLLSCRHMGQNLQPIGLDCFVIILGFTSTSNRKPSEKSDRDTSNIMNIFSSSHSGWASIAQGRNQSARGGSGCKSGLVSGNDLVGTAPRAASLQKCRTCYQMGLSQAPVKYAAMRKDSVKPHKISSSIKICIKPLDITLIRLNIIEWSPNAIGRTLASTMCTIAIFCWYTLWYINSSTLAVIGVGRLVSHYKLVIFRVYVNLPEGTL